MPEAAEMVVQVDSPTELRNRHTVDIDTVETAELVGRINAEDQLVAPAVAAVLPAVTEMVEVGIATLRRGGRVHYFGAGTSGRVAFVDAAEIPPTFGVPDDRIVAHHAGDSEALRAANEGTEDAEQAGAADAAMVAADDLVIGVSASGRTPYVAGALRRAAARGARTALVSSNPRARIGLDTDIHVAVETGPEAITGSTRLKAGTAAKMVLNTFSTAVMVKLGRTYSNLMIDVAASNAKLRGRQVVMLMEATGLAEHRCAEALALSENSPPVALVCLLGGVSPQRSRMLLNRHHGAVRDALAELNTTEPRSDTPPTQDLSDTRRPRNGRSG